MSPPDIETRLDSEPEPTCDPASVSAMERRCAEARRRLNGVPGDPFLFADWERVLFLHFTIDPALLKPHVPAPFELELYGGAACLSLVCVTMRKFRPCRSDTAAFPFRCIREQRFLNLRTYVRFRAESGALFLHGWLSKPAPLPFPSGMISLPYTFARLEFEHVPTDSMIRGSIKRKDLEFSYSATIPAIDWCPADPGSMAEFVMERYSGFFARGHSAYVFRAWHPVWMQKPVDAKIESETLIARHFEPWSQAKFAGANLADTFERVELGKAHRVFNLPLQDNRHRALSRMFELP